MDDDRRSMLIFLLFLLFIPIDSVRSSRNLNELLHQQYENRQNLSEKPTNFSRSWPRSNSIVMLKKYIANRQRLANTTRSSTTTSTSTTTTTTTTTTTSSTTTRVAPRLFLRFDPNIQTTNFYHAPWRDETSAHPVPANVFTSETSTVSTTTSTTTRTTTTTTTTTTTAIKPAPSPNSTVLIIILVCSFSGVVLLGLIVLFLLRFVDRSDWARRSQLFLL